MSHAALCFAVRDRIRAVLGYSTRDCELAPQGGHAPAKCGLWFVGVWPGSCRNGDRNGIKRFYNVNVTLTALVKNPADQIAVKEISKVAGAPLGFTERLEAIADVVGKDTYNLLVGRAANVYLSDQNMTGDELTGFRQGLWWTDTTEPRLVGPEWFWADPSGPAIAGIVADIHFADALRIKNFANIVGDFP